ncbi:MAG: CHAT domain-containing protein, partial [Nitrospiraceae bacterium]
PPKAEVSVYNILIAPLKSSDPLVLRADQPTQIKFSIGKPLAGSVLQQTEIDDRIGKLAEGKKAQIDVRMICGVCSEDATQIATISFDPASRQSTEAKFNIVPRSAKVERGATGVIFFILKMKGFELNQIEVETFVDEVDQASLKNYRKPTIAFLPLPGNPGAPPDLVLSLTTDGTDNKVALTIEPYLEGLRLALGSRVRDGADKTWRKFSLAFSATDQNVLTRRSEEAYQRLRQMTTSNTELRQKLRDVYKNQGAGTFVLSFPSSELKLLDHHRDKALLAFKDVGRNIYRLLFSDLYGASNDLVAALQIIEGYKAPGGRPLKISIETSYFVPWQLLYPLRADDATDEVHPENFWGFKFDFAVRQIVRGMKQRIDLEPRRARPGDVVFARGKPLDATDPLTRFADDLVKSITHSFDPPAKTGVRIVDSDVAFLQSLKDNAKNLQLVFLFSHGTSGTYTLMTSDGVPVSLADDVGPRFIFSPNELVTPARIEEIYDAFLYVPIWPRQPIFILNACESGTGGAQPANSGVFVTLLMRLGANAVLVTESEVWAEFARAWAQSLVEELKTGTDMSRAVLNARLTHLKQGRNPMGLLYSLYGHPSARIQFVSTP